MSEYDHRNETQATRADCEAVVGKKASLHLTGEIVSVENTCNGWFVRFKVDERWGFGEFRVGLDLEALDIEEGEHATAEKQITNAVENAELIIETAKKAQESGELDLRGYAYAQGRKDAARVILLSFVRTV